MVGNESWERLIWIWPWTQFARYLVVHVSFHSALFWWVSRCRLPEAPKILTFRNLSTFSEFIKGCSDLHLEWDWNLNMFTFRTFQEHTFQACPKMVNTPSCGHWLPKMKPGDKPGDSAWRKTIYLLYGGRYSPPKYWLVVWNMIFMFPYIGNINHPIWLSYFSEG